MFIKHTKGGNVIIPIVYVDDIIITRNDEIEKMSLRDCLACEFEIKKLGKLKYFLGIEVACTKQEIFISQRKYVLDLLKETKKLSSKSANVPIEQNHRLGNEKLGNVVDNRELPTACWKTNLPITQKAKYSLCNQFMHDPREEHLQAVQNILQCLKTTPRRGLLSKKGGRLTVDIYTDSNYAKSHVNRKSTIGYCMFL